ncbi:hypothetical protein ACIP4Q_35425 [Streptomyces massasporeus]
MADEPGGGVRAGRSPVRGSTKDVMTTPPDAPTVALPGRLLVVDLIGGT